MYFLNSGVKGLIYLYSVVHLKVGGAELDAHRKWAGSEGQNRWNFRFR